MSLNEFDIFVGIQQSKIDVKNPMPTRSANQPVDEPFGYSF